MPMDRISGVDASTERRVMALPLIRVLCTSSSLEERVKARENLNDNFKRETGKKNIGELSAAIANGEGRLGDEKVLNDYRQLTMEVLSVYKGGRLASEINNITDWDEKETLLRNRLWRDSALEGFEETVLEKVFGEKKPGQPVNEERNQNTTGVQGIKNEKVREVMDIFNKRRKIWEAAGPTVLGKNIERTIEELSGLVDIVDGNGYDEITKISAYLGGERDRLGGEGDGVDMGDKVVRKLEEIERKKEEERLKQEQKIMEAKEIQNEKDRSDFFMAMLVHEDPQSADPFSGYAPEWMRDYPDKALLKKIVALHNTAYAKLRYGNQLLDELLDTKAGGTYSASNEIMRKMINEIPGVKESLWHFVDKYSEPAEVSGKYMLRLKGQAAVDRVRKQVEAYKAVGQNVPDDLAERLREVEEPYKEWIKEEFGHIRDNQMEWVRTLNASRVRGVNNETDALEATAIAWCFLFSGHFFESIDWSKDIPSCEASVAQAWSFCHPNEKMRNKVLWKERDEGDKVIGTEEGWGGNKGQWIVRRFELARQGSVKDKEFVKKFITGVIKPFPEMMFCSFVEDADVVVDGGSKISMAQALKEKRRIRWDMMPQSADPWGSYYDFADSANKLYQVTTGKLQAGFAAKDLTKTEELIGKIADARNKLRGSSLWRSMVDNKEFMLWALAGAVPDGLFKESSEMILMTADVTMGSQQRNMEYFLKLRELVPNKADRDWVLTQLHCKGPLSEVSRKKIMNPLTRDL